MSLEKLIGPLWKFCHRCVFGQGNPLLNVGSHQIWTLDIDLIRFGRALHSSSALVMIMKWWWWLWWWTWWWWRWKAMLVCSMMRQWSSVRSSWFNVGVQYDEAMKQCEEFMVLYNSLRAEMSGQHQQHRHVRRQNRRLSMSTMFDCTFNSVTSSTVDKYVLTRSASLTLLSINMCVCACLL